MAQQALRAELAGDSVSALLKSINIPPCPSVVSALMTEMRRDNSDFNRVGRLLAGDVSLAASMMKTANSPFFGLRRKVPSVQQALAVLGMKNVVSIVTGLALQQAVSPRGVNMERFWERSSLHAVVCSRMARHLPGVGREDAYTFGLFHDCGIPVLMQRFPDYKETLATANRSGQPFVDVEFDAHATSHVIVGGMLARNWQLPDLVAEAIRLHHDPDVLHGRAADVAEPVRALVCVSTLADRLAAEFLGFEADVEWAHAGAAVLDYLGLDEGEIDDIRVDIGDDLAEMLALRK